MVGHAEWGCAGSPASRETLPANEYIFIRQGRPWQSISSMTENKHDPLSPDSLRVSRRIIPELIFSYLRCVLILMNATYCFSSWCQERPIGVVHKSWSKAWWDICVILDIAGVLTTARPFMFPDRDRISRTTTWASLRSMMNSASTYIEVMQVEMKSRYCTRRKVLPDCVKIGYRHFPTNREYVIDYEWHTTKPECLESAKEVARLAEQRPLPTRDTRVSSYVTLINEIFYFFNDINDFDMLGFAQSDERRSFVTGIVEEN